MACVHPRTFCTATLVLQIALASVSQADDAPGGRVADRDEGRWRRLELDRDRESEHSSLDWVLERVSASRDDWRAEAVSEHLLGTLRRLGPALEGESPIGDLRSILSPRFRAHSLVPRGLSTSYQRSGLEVVRGAVADAADARELGRDAWLEELERLRASIGSVDRATLKIFQVEATGAPEGRVTTRALVELRGGDGGRSQILATWDVEWERGSESEGGPGDAAPDETADEWRITTVRVVSHEMLRLSRRSFLDVTAAAFGHNASFAGQLGVGAGEWYTRLDAASGIDIYGHQGLAVGDVDGDGLEDIYVAQPAGLPNRLFRSRGDGRFDDRTETSGVAVLDSTGGPLLIDLDGDRDLDLVVPASLELLLFENDGRGHFRRKEDCGLDVVSGRRATALGCAAADADRDGDLDLYVFSYVFWAGSGSKLESSYPFPYHDANNGAPNFLFRNEGALRFRDVTTESGLDENNRRFSLAASFCDYDDDGDPDLYVANDFGANNLYRNDGDGHFRDVAPELGLEDRGNGMSVTWGDWNEDGRSDLYVGNMWSSAGNRIAFQERFGDAELRAIYLRMARGNSLFENLGGGRFRDRTEESGIAFGRWAWSCQSVDVEGDGHDEIYVANGFVSGALQDDL